MLTYFYRSGSNRANFITLYAKINLFLAVSRGGSRLDSVRGFTDRTRTSVLTPFEVMGSHVAAAKCKCANKC